MRRALLLFLLLSPSLPAAWFHDLAEARRQAKADEKDILLVFTALEISGACVQFERRVISQESFRKATEDRLVLVHLDIPLEATPGIDSPKADHRMMARQFSVETFPAIFWLDSRGRPFASARGALAGTAGEVAAQVLAKQEAENGRREELREAYELSGMDRARAIVRVLKEKVTGADPARDQDHLAELARLDPRDTLGFQAIRKAEIAFGDLEIRLQDAFREGAHAEAVRLVDGFLKDHRPPSGMRQKLLFRKLAALEKTGPLKEAREVARLVVELDPESPHGRFARQILEKLEER